jgi:uncharacterized membrane protein
MSITRGAETTRATVVTGVLIGIGLAGTLDEAVMHQVLDWHHFYDPSTRGAPLDERARTVGLLADGLFHLLSTALLALGLLRLSRARRTAGFTRRVWGGILAGAGGFNLYDATVQHKLLRLHQVRRGVTELLPYDLAFGGIALALLLAGIWLLRRAPADQA